MNLKLVLDIAPPTPPCFPSRLVWADYLLHCQLDGKRPSAQPFVRGIYRAAFNFCADCSVAHADAMRAVGRCVPDALSGLPSATTAPSDV